MKTVQIASLPIKLGQFLKLTACVEDGHEAKQIIAAGRIRINGEVIRERGKKLYINDLIEIESGPSFQIAASL